MNPTTVTQAASTVTRTEVTAFDTAPSHATPPIITAPLTTRPLPTSALPASSAPAINNGTARHGLRTFLVRLAVLVLALASSIGVAAGTASASYGTTSLDASCQSASVTAWGPNLEGYTGWGVTWGPTLYRFNGTSWDRYLVGATQTDTATSWYVHQVIFSGMPKGYYQVRDNSVWHYNGRVSGQLNYLVPVRHFLNGSATGFTLNERRLSTSSYCYIG